MPVDDAADQLLMSVGVDLAPVKKSAKQVEDFFQDSAKGVARSFDAIVKAISDSGTKTISTLDAITSEQEKNINKLKKAIESAVAASTTSARGEDKKSEVIQKQVAGLKTSVEIQKQALQIQEQIARTIKEQSTEFQLADQQRTTALTNELGLLHKIVSENKLLTTEIEHQAGLIVSGAGREASGKLGPGTASSMLKEMSTLPSTAYDQTTKAIEYSIARVIPQVAGSLPGNKATAAFLPTAATAQDASANKIAAAIEKAVQAPEKTLHQQPVTRAFISEENLEKMPIRTRSKEIADTNVLIAKNRELLLEAQEELNKRREASSHQQAIVNTIRKQVVNQQQEYRTQQESVRVAQERVSVQAESIRLQQKSGQLTKEQAEAQLAAAAVQRNALRQQMADLAQAAALKATAARASLAPQLETLEELKAEENARRLIIEQINSATRAQQAYVRTVAASVRETQEQKEQGLMGRMSEALFGGGLGGRLARGVVAGGIIGGMATSIPSMIASITEKLKEAVLEGGRFTQIQNVFAGVSGSLEKSNQLLGEMREKSEGLISDSTLMQIATAAMGHGYKTTTEEVIGLTQAVQRLAERRGKVTPEFAGQRLERMLSSGRMSIRALGQSFGYTQAELASFNFAPIMDRNARSVAQVTQEIKQLTELGNKVGAVPETIESGIEKVKARLESLFKWFSLGFNRSVGTQLFLRQLDDISTGLSGLTDTARKAGNIAGAGLAVITPVLKAIGEIASAVGQEIAANFDGAKSGLGGFAKQTLSLRDVLRDFILGIQAAGHFVSGLIRMMADLAPITANVAKAFLLWKGVILGLKGISWTGEKAVELLTFTSKLVESIAALNKARLAQILLGRTVVATEKSIAVAEGEAAAGAGLFATLGGALTRVRVAAAGLWAAIAGIGGVTGTAIVGLTSLAAVALNIGHSADRIAHMVGLISDEDYNKRLTQDSFVDRMAKKVKGTVTGTFAQLKADKEDFDKKLADIEKHKGDIGDPANNEIQPANEIRNRIRLEKEIHRQQIQLAREVKAEAQGLAKERIALAQEGIQEEKQVEEQAYQSGEQTAKAHYAKLRQFAQESNKAKLEELKVEHEATVQSARDDFEANKRDLVFQENLTIDSLVYKKRLATLVQGLNSKNLTENESNQTKLLQQEQRFNSEMNQVQKQELRDTREARLKDIQIQLQTTEKALESQRQFREKAFQTGDLQPEQYFKEEILNVNNLAQARMKAARETYFINPDSQVQAQEYISKVSSEIQEAQDKLRNLQEGAIERYTSYTQRYFEPQQKAIEAQIALQQQLAQVGNAPYQYLAPTSSLIKDISQSLESQKKILVESLHTQKEGSEEWFSLYNQIEGIYGQQIRWNDALRETVDLTRPIGSAIGTIAQQMGKVFHSRSMQNVADVLQQGAEQLQRSQQLRDMIFGKPLPKKSPEQLEMESTAKGLFRAIGNSTSEIITPFHSLAIIADGLGAALEHSRMAAEAEVAWRGRLTDTEAPQINNQGAYQSELVDSALAKVLPKPGDYHLGKTSASLEHHAMDGREAEKIHDAGEAAKGTAEALKQATQTIKSEQAGLWSQFKEAVKGLFGSGPQVTPQAKKFAPDTYGIHVGPSTDIRPQTEKFTPQTYNLKMYAEGGRPEVGEPSIIGEKGREIFVPDRPGTILPNDYLNPQFIQKLIQPEPGIRSASHPFLSRIREAVFGPNTALGSLAGDKTEKPLVNFEDLISPISRSWLANVSRGVVGEIAQFTSPQNLAMMGALGGEMGPVLQRALAGAFTVESLRNLWDNSTAFQQATKNKDSEAAAGIIGRSILDVVMMRMAGHKALKGIPTGSERGSLPIDLSRFSGPDLRSKGFYSQLENVIEQKIPNRVSVEQARAILNNPQNGVKPDELKWTGVDRWLGEQQGTLTKQQILEYAQQNAVQIRDVQVKDSKYARYKLPGGENYRELLFKLKRRASPKAVDESFNKKYGATSQWTDDVWLQYNAARNPASYVSSHWSTEDVLAHVRLTDHLDTDGKKVLTVEEIQSDWHQAGRDKGYITPELQQQATEAAKKYRELQREWDAITRTNDYIKWLEHHSDKDFGLNPAPTSTVEKIEDLYERYDAARSASKQFEQQEGRVPDAPFSKNWHELVFKRVAQHAAEKGYDKVAWTTGKQQAQRYDLAQFATEIEWKPESNSLRYQQLGRPAKFKDVSDVTESNLADFVGKDAARKLLALHTEGKKAVISGQDLQVGGQGMSGFYDQILPQYAAKFGKKYGAEVGETELKESPKVHSLDVTSKMREELLKHGQPLFSLLPLGIGAGLLGQEDQDSENNNLKMYAEGGRPEVGEPGIVGEKGRELFVPDALGILPSNILDTIRQLVQRATEARPAQKQVVSPFHPTTHGIHVVGQPKPSPTSRLGAFASSWNPADLVPEINRSSLAQGFTDTWDVTSGPPVIKRYALDIPSEERGKASEAWKKGNYGMALGHAIASIPGTGFASDLYTAQEEAAARGIKEFQEPGKKIDAISHILLSGIPLLGPNAISIADRLSSGDSTEIQRGIGELLGFVVAGQIPLGGASIAARSIAGSAAGALARRSTGALLQHPVVQALADESGGIGSFRSKQAYAFFDHPTRGAVVHEGNAAHRALAEKYGIDYKGEEARLPRGIAEVNHLLRSVKVTSYGFTDVPGVDIGPRVKEAIGGIDKYRVSTKRTSAVDPWADYRHRLVERLRDETGSVSIGPISEEPLTDPRLTDPDPRLAFRDYLSGPDGAVDVPDRLLGSASKGSLLSGDSIAAFFGALLPQLPYPDYSKKTQYGGHRQFGGPVWPGYSYDVGEGGTERFHPSVPGTITPHVDEEGKVENLLTLLGTVSSSLFDNFNINLLNSINRVKDQKVAPSSNIFQSRQFQPSTDHQIVNKRAQQIPDLLTLTALLNLQRPQQKGPLDVVKPVENQSKTTLQSINFIELTSAIKLLTGVLENVRSKIQSVTTGDQQPAGGSGGYPAIKSPVAVQTSKLVSDSKLASDSDNASAYLPKIQDTSRIGSTISSVSSLLTGAATSTSTAVTSTGHALGSSIGTVKSALTDFYNAIKTTISRILGISTNKQSQSGTDTQTQPGLIGTLGNELSGIFHGGKYGPVSAGTSGLEISTSESGTPSSGLPNQQLSGAPDFQSTFGSASESLGSFTQALAGAVGAVGGFIGTITSAKSPLAGALGGIQGGAQIGSMFGPIGEAVGAVAGGILGGIVGQKNKEIQRNLDTATANFRLIMAEFAQNNNNLQQTIVQVQSIINQLYADRNSSKKGKSQYNQAISQYQQELVQLQNQQIQLTNSLYKNTSVLSAPQGMQDLLTNLQQILGQYDQFVGAVKNTQDLAQANKYLAGSLANLEQQSLTQFNQNEEQAINDAIQLNDLLYQRWTLTKQYNDQVQSVLAQGVLTRQLTMAQTKGQQIEQMSVDYQRQMQNLNEQIQVTQYKVQAEQQIFQLATTRADLEMQLAQVQEQSVHMDMLRISALAQLVQAMQSGNWSFGPLQNIINSAQAAMPPTTNPTVGISNLTQAINQELGTSNANASTLNQNLATTQGELKIAAGLLNPTSALPKFAQGGYVPPNTAAIVGDEGAELLLAGKQGNTVIPLNNDSLLSALLGAQQQSNQHLAKIAGSLIMALTSGTRSVGGQNLLDKLVSAAYQDRALSGFANFRGQNL